MVAQLDLLADRFVWTSASGWLERQPAWLRRMVQLRDPSDNGANLALMVGGLRSSIEDEDPAGEVLVLLLALRTIGVPPDSAIFHRLDEAVGELGNSCIEGQLHVARARSLIFNESSPRAILEALGLAVDAAEAAQEQYLDDSVSDVFGSYGVIVGAYDASRRSCEFILAREPVGSRVWVLCHLNLAGIDISTGDLGAARRRYSEAGPYLSSAPLPVQNFAEWIRILSAEHLEAFEAARLSTAEALAVRQRAVRRFLLSDLVGIVPVEDCIEEILAGVPSDPVTGFVPVPTLRTVLAESVAIGRPTQLAALGLPEMLTATGRVGDEAAARLVTAVAGRFRPAIDAGLIVARIDVDRYAVFGDLDPIAFDGLLEHLVKELQRPISLDTEAADLLLQPSVTVARSIAGDTGYSVWERAFGAAGAEVPGTVRLASPASDEDEQRFLLVQELLSDGLETHVTMEFQPIVDTRDRRVNGFESLLRWTSPDLGRLNPALVVEVAEQCGALARLERCIVSNAIQGAAMLQATDSACRVNINLTSAQLGDTSMVEYLIEECERSSVAPSTIGIELTESTLLNYGAATPALEMLAARGFTTALDDFGTGYSNLSYLVEMRNVGLKIDGSFVRGIVDDERAQAVCRMLIVAAQTLNVPIVAEQVETDAHADRLHDLGCALHQGFRYAPSLPLEQACVVLVDPLSKWDWPDFSEPTESAARM